MAILHKLGAIVPANTAVIKTRLRRGVPSWIDAKLRLRYTAPSPVRNVFQNCDTHSVVYLAYLFYLYKQPFDIKYFPKFQFCQIKNCKWEIQKSKLDLK